MENITILDDRSWRHRLEGRKTLSFFTVPKIIARTHIVREGTRRRIRIELSDGRRLSGFCTVACGRQIYLPARLKRILSSLEWIQFELLNSDQSETSFLEWE